MKLKVLIVVLAGLLPMQEEERERKRKKEKERERKEKRSKVEVEAAADVTAAPSIVNSSLFLSLCLSLPRIKASPQSWFQLSSPSLEKADLKDYIIVMEEHQRAERRGEEEEMEEGRERWHQNDERD